MAHRDPRYDLIKIMIIQGSIKSFNDIFKFIPKTIVATDLGKKVDRFTELMNRVEEFTLHELFIIANFCQVEESDMVKLALNEYLINKEKKSNPEK